MNYKHQAYSMELELVYILLIIYITNFSPIKWNIDHFISCMVHTYNGQGKMMDWWTLKYMVVGLTICLILSSGCVNHPIKSASY